MAVLPCQASAAGRQAGKQALQAAQAHLGISPRCRLKMRLATASLRCVARGVWRGAVRRGAPSTELEHRAGFQTFSTEAVTRRLLTNKLTGRYAGAGGSRPLRSTLGCSPGRSPGEGVPLVYDAQLPMLSQGEDWPGGGGGCCNSRRRCTAEAEGPATLPGESVGRGAPS